jgi:hypothetical protein
MFSGEIKSVEDLLRNFKFKRLESKGEKFGIDELKSRLEKLLIDNEDNFNKNPELFIGTDSKKRGPFVYFALVVILYFEKSGGAVFFCRNVEKIKMNMESRLIREAEYSLAAATKLVDLCNEYAIPMSIHCDYNPNPAHKSNGVVSAALGYITGMGFNGKIKPDSWAATTAADLIVKGVRN